MTRWPKKSKRKVKRRNRQKEKELALEKADLEHQGDLAAQKSALEKENAKALSAKEKVFSKKLALQKRLLAEVAEELE